MSEIGLNINVDSCNNEGIKTIKGNNNAEIYKLYILKNKRRLSLVGKTVKLGYVMVGTTNGDVIENLNITNAEQGEITFPITNRISKKDGVYSCQLAIYGADGFLEHTATFTLTVENNIFSDITKAIVDSKDFTYLENILDKASKLSEKLKENTSSATNANSNLESNITEANNINSKLLENTSTATSLNKNLESNIDLAKEVKETIKDLDTKNIEATEKIETLTDLNNKAQELSNNINQALPLNSELVKNTESAKVTNTNLAATNQEATTKNTELQASLEKTKEFINGLDGSQNIPQIRMDVTELQNGLKSNQALAYTGSSISADNTLEGRTEGMKIEGKTMYKKADGTYTDTWEEGVTLESFGEKEGNKISILSTGKNLTNCKFELGIWNVSPTDQEPNKQSNSNYVRSSELIDISKFNDQQISISLNGKSVEGNIKYYTKDRKYIKDVFQAPFNPVPNAFYITIHVPLSRFSKYDEFQIETGSNSTSYEPYKCDKKDILIKEPLHEGNYLYEDNGQVKVYKEAKKYIFNGDENWSKHSNSGNGLFVAIIWDGFSDCSPTSSVVCNKLKNERTTSKENVIYFVSKCPIITVSEKTIGGDTVEHFKTWLKSNPIEIIYQLATPVTEVVENCVDIDLDTYQEKTYFNILNSLQGTLDFKVPSNIGSVVQNMAKEVNNIWDVINNLLVPSIVKANGNLAMIKLNNNLK
ncbi:BppU family phage baseplate upper protein [Clostridium perfringens]